MKELFFCIADYNICFVSVDPEINIHVNSIYATFLSKKTEHVDLKIYIQSDFPSIFNNLNKILKTDYSNGSTEISPLDNWCVSEQNGLFYLVSYGSEKADIPAYVIEMTSQKEWNFYFNRNSVAPDNIDPVTPPLGSLLLYYLTTLKGDIMIHASGLYDGSMGRLFSGVSGIGKTTMARIWKKNGAVVISDDRIILRNINGEILMYNTPIHETDFSKKAKLDEIYLLRQSPNNEMSKILGVAAVSRVLSGCIQQDYKREIISTLLDSISLMCSKVPVYELGFFPDENVIEFIKKATLNFEKH